MKLEKLEMIAEALFIKAKEYRKEKIETKTKVLTQDFFDYDERSSTLSTLQRRYEESDTLGNRSFCFKEACKVFSMPCEHASTISPKQVVSIYFKNVAKKATPKPNFEVILAKIIMEGDNIKSFSFDELFSLIKD